MKKVAVFVLISSLILGLVACDKTPTGPVAIVNGVEITREAFASELEYDLEYYTSQGMELTDQELAEVKQIVVDRLINTHLLKEAALKAGINADTVDVDGELAAIMESFEDEADFAQALAEADFTLESYRQVLADMLMIEALFEQELELSKIEVEEEAIEAMIASYLEYYEEDDTDEEELREYAIYVLKERKIESLRLEYLEKLRGESDIEYLDF
ncbi:MAG: hypothetical protein GX065_07830 [Firmicutes bacterium]|jgi:hypothetical protein|nr:hypothetical protein [Bacillota bacterium]